MEKVKLLAQVDTGASNCLFERQHGEMLRFKIEAGESMTFSTAVGLVKAFGHFVTLEMLGLQFESLVYFLADERVNRNLLGRIGWLDRVRLGLVDHDGELYLSPYDSQNS